MGPSPLEPPDWLSSPEYVAVGRVIKPHGLHGEVQVKVLSDNPHRFDAGSQMFCGTDISSLSPINVSASYPYQAGLRVRFVAVDDAAAA
ncbi:MAG: hypothetical protein WD602_07150, partial [Actinomycetota bacterium]